MLIQEVPLIANYHFKSEEITVESGKFNLYPIPYVKFYDWKSGVNEEGILWLDKYFKPTGKAFVHYFYGNGYISDTIKIFNGGTPYYYIFYRYCNDTKYATIREVTQS